MYMYMWFGSTCASNRNAHLYREFVKKYMYNDQVYTVLGNANSVSLRVYRYISGGH